MKRIVLAFLATASAGLVVFLLVNLVHPVENTARFVNVTWQCSAFMAIVAGLIELKRRANQRLARSRAEGPSQLPDQFPEVIRASAVQPPQGAAGPRTGGVPVPKTEERPVVFKPRGVLMLIVALLLAGVAAFYILGLGVLERGPLSGTVNVLGLATTGVAVVGAVLCFCFFVYRHLPGKKIRVYSWGVILPGRIRVTWDVFTEIRLRKLWGIGALATLRLRLKDGRRIRIARHHIGCAPRKLYEAIQASFEEHEKCAQRSRQQSEPRGAPLRPRTAARSR